MARPDRRVVVTGAAAISPLGQDWASIHARLRARTNAVRYIPEWEVFDGLNTRLAAPAEDVELPSNYNRKTTRSMGKVAVMSVRATELALEAAGLLGHPVLRSGMAGVAYGSSSGSHEATAEFGRMLHEHTTEGISATTYLKMMSHTSPVNIGVFFGLSGRVYTTSSACTSGSQGVGSGYEAIRSGKQTVMVTGGAEQLDATAAAVFDTLFATSVRNDAPQTPRSWPKWSATAPTATASTSPRPAPAPWPRRCGWRWRMPTWLPTGSATSTRMAPPPSTATSPKPRPPTRCSAPACRSARSKAM